MTNELETVSPVGLGEWFAIFRGNLAIKDSGNLKGPDALRLLMDRAILPALTVAYPDLVAEFCANGYLNLTDKGKENLIRMAEARWNQERKRFHEVLTGNAGDLNIFGDE